MTSKQIDFFVLNFFLKLLNKLMEGVKYIPELQWNK